MSRHKTFTATDQEGRRYTWAFWHDKYWMLRDPDGYVRTLEKNWLDSVPRINLILENYGQKANIS